MIGTKAEEPTDIYREIHFREPNRFPISRSRNRSVLSVLEYRPNGSTEPIRNPERVGPNRPKHAIYRFGSNRESVLDRPNASSDLKCKYWYPPCCNRHQCKCFIISLLLCILWLIQKTIPTCFGFFTIFMKWFDTNALLFLQLNFTGYFV